MKKIIGIIGGNGVTATNKLLKLIEEYYTKNGAYRDAHHPEIITWQATQAPSRSMYLEGRGESFIPEYIKIGKNLKNCGTTLLCMCCNTAHYAIEELENAIGLPFINIIENTVQECKRLERKRIGILASDGCIKENLYGNYFAKLYPEAELIYPLEQEQNKVTQGICNVKNSIRFLDDSHPNRSLKLFNSVNEHLSLRGCDTIVLGCTDISVDFKNNTNLLVIDSLEVLANRLCSL